MVGGATAHYRADPGSFYGIDLLALSSRATSCGPGICSWRSSGSPRPTSPAACSSPRRWAERSRRGRSRGINVLFLALVRRRLRQPAGRNARHQPAAREPLVLVRAPGLGVSRPGAGLADPAGGRPRVLAGPALPGGPAGAARPREAGDLRGLPAARPSASPCSTCRRCSSRAPRTSPSWTCGGSGSSTSGSKGSSSCSSP